MIEISSGILCCGCSTGEIIIFDVDVCTLFFPRLQFQKENIIQEQKGEHKGQITCMARWQSYIWVADEKGVLSLWHVVASPQVKLDNMTI